MGRPAAVVDAAAEGGRRHGGLGGDPMSEENKKWLTQVMQEGVVDLVQRTKK